MCLSDLQVRTDLIDTQISICAPEVLMLFSDNFDYQNIKRDFVSGKWQRTYCHADTVWTHQFRRICLRFIPS